LKRLWKLAAPDRLRARPLGDDFKVLLEPGSSFNRMLLQEANQDFQATVDEWIDELLKTLPL
jgi:hypothetical protein